MAEEEHLLSLLQTTTPKLFLHRFNVNVRYDAINRYSVVTTDDWDASVNLLQVVLARRRPPNSNQTSLIPYTDMAGNILCGCLKDSS